MPETEFSMEIEAALDCGNLTSINFHSGSSEDKKKRLSSLITHCTQTTLTLNKQTIFIDFIASLFISRTIDPQLFYDVIAEKPDEQIRKIISIAIQTEKLSFIYFFLDSLAQRGKDIAILIAPSKDLLQKKIDKFNSMPLSNKQFLIKLEHLITPKNTLLAEMIAPSVYNGDNAIPGDKKYQLDHPVLFTIKALQGYIDRLFQDEQSPFKDAEMILLSHRAQEGSISYFSQKTDITAYGFSNNKKLQIVARNESSNESGFFNNQLLLSKSNNPHKHAYIISAKDLVTFSQLKIAPAKIQHKITPFKSYDAYIIDLIGPQFKIWDNTGRIVFIFEDDSLPKGIYDNEIFKTLVSEEKATYAQCVADNTGRYIKAEFLCQKGYIDTFAYEKIVAHQLKATLFALNQQALEDDIAGISLRFPIHSPDDFLTGLAAFPENKTRDDVINHCRLRGIIIGLSELVDNKQQIRKIKSLELFYYNQNADNESQLKTIGDICKEALNIHFTIINSENELEPANHPWKLSIISVTNPHAQPRNKKNASPTNPDIYEHTETTGLDSNCAVNFAMRERMITTKTYSHANNNEKIALIIEALKQAASFYKRRTPSAASYKLLPIHGETGMKLANEIMIATFTLDYIGTLLNPAINSLQATTAHSLYSYLARSLYNLLPGMEQMHFEHDWILSKRNTEINAQVFEVAIREVEKLVREVRCVLQFT